MSRKLVFIWSCIVVWASSAFIHMVDADVDGVQGLLSPSKLASVTVVAALMLLPILAFWMAFRRGRWRGLFGAIVVLGIGLRLIVGAMGDVGASLSGDQPIAAVGLLYGVVAVLALIPAILVERRIEGQATAAAVLRRQELRESQKERPAQGDPDEHDDPDQQVLPDTTAAQPAEVERDGDNT